MPLGAPLRGRVRHALDNPFTRNVDPTLVLDLPFSEGVGNIVRDRSLYGNHGTINGASWVDGKIGKALSFDGIDDYVTVPHNAVFNFGLNNFSISLWVKTVGFDYPPRFIIVKHDSGFDVYWSIEMWGTGEIRAYGTPNSYALSPSGYADNLWHHVVLVRENMLMKLYIDTVFVEPITDDWSDNMSFDGDIEIGACQAEPMPFYGSIDEIRIYNRALSDADILRL